MSVSPVSRNRVAPSEKWVLSNRMPLPAVAASSTFSASAMTSGPMPSPGMTASFTTRGLLSAFGRHRSSRYAAPRARADAAITVGQMHGQWSTRTRCGRPPSVSAAIDAATTMRAAPMSAVTPTPASNAWAAASRSACPERLLETVRMRRRLRRASRARHPLPRRAGLPAAEVRAVERGQDAAHDRRAEHRAELVRRLGHGARRARLRGGALARISSFDTVSAAPMPTPSERTPRSAAAATGCRR